MEVSFQHTNPAAGHESTLLKISPREEDTFCYLLDAGESVSPGAFIGADESLAGVFLTHAHTDHYRSLSQVLSLSNETPLYTSTATANIIEQVYSEADQYQDLGDVSRITEALTPIENWTELNDRVHVLPLPAGHTPGAVAFLFRVDDIEQTGETVTVLATGDFTTRPTAGYPGLTIPEPIHVDIMIANAATNEEFPETLSKALETILEQALSGATTLVAASALTSIHIAYLLGYALDELERQVPIHLVGQGAKLYNRLGYDISRVKAHPQFDHTHEVLSSGAVTIAGPETPTQSSSGRLFGVIEEDPGAALVQVITAGSESVDSSTCTTYDFELSNHPSEDQFIDFVEENFPRHLILKHIYPESGKALGSSFENLFFWANDDTREHLLYDDGDWLGPHWMSDATIDRIRRGNYRASDPRMPLEGPIEQLPTVQWDRKALSLEAEGLDMDSLIDQFEKIAGQPPQIEATTSDGGQSTTVDETETEIETGTAQSDSTGKAEQRRQESYIDEEFQNEVREQLETLEAIVEELTESVSTQQRVEDGFDDIQARFDEIETGLNDLPGELANVDKQSVPARVVQQEDLLMFRIDSEAVDNEILQALEHDQEVEISIDDPKK